MNKSKPSDAGAYIGHEPELSQETIPGGVQPTDERIAGTATQGTGVGAQKRRADSPPAPEGHRQGSRATHDDAREAGENG